MFSLASVQIRKYEFENPEGGVLHVRPPKLQTLEIFNKVFTDAHSTPKDMAGMIGAILSDNDEEIKITSKQVMYWMDSDQLGAFVEDFMGWLNDTKESNPN